MKILENNYNITQEEKIKKNVNFLKFRNDDIKCPHCKSKIEYNLLDIKTRPIIKTIKKFLFIKKSWSYDELYISCPLCQKDIIIEAKNMVIDYHRFIIGGW